MIRTKIVATMGPACGTVDSLLHLFEAGADVCRLNFSHGDLATHLQMLGNIREAAARFRQPVAVLGDLGGPKIRLGKVDDIDGSGGMPIHVGDELIFQREPIAGKNRRVSTTYPHFVDDVQVGHRVLIEDGMLRFLCSDKSNDEIRCVCTAGGVLKSSKGINLPQTKVAVPSITDKDWECVDWAVANDLDYLALSFVRKADDIHQLREHLKKRGSDIRIIAKIEKAEALHELDAILDTSDGLMVARGDLGVEMDVAQVPIIQKNLIRRCQAAGKPVIVATQMLQSMIEQSSPTRAEVSDVANAIMDCTDAVMLSGETSVGKYPIGAVHVMSHVAEVTEEYQTANPPVRDLKKLPGLPISAAVARGVWQMVSDLDIKLVAMWSETGTKARIFSKNRFPVPIVALSSSQRSLRRMALCYGVIPHELTRPASMKALVESIDAIVEERNLANRGDSIVIVTGPSLGLTNDMNGIIIHTVGEEYSDDVKS